MLANLLNPFPQIQGLILVDFPGGGHGTTRGSIALTFERGVACKARACAIVIPVPKPECTLMQMTYTGLELYYIE